MEIFRATKPKHNKLFMILKQFEIMHHLCGHVRFVIAHVPYCTLGSKLKFRYLYADV
jgi:hypothetical protein